MREIIRTLIHEGIETEDILAITRYLMEEYEVNEEISDKKIKRAAKSVLLPRYIEQEHTSKDFLKTNPDDEEAHTKAYEKNKNAFDRIVKAELASKYGKKGLEMFKNKEFPES